MAGMCRQGINARELLRTFLAMAGCFLLLTLALKTVEFCIAETELPHKSAKGLQLLVNALAYNGIAASWALLGVGVLHLLVGLFSPKAAKAATATLLGLMLLAETGLMLYTMHNGFLLGSELFARPLGETLMAIRGAMGVALPIVLTLLLLGGFIALSLWLAATAPGRGENCAMGRAGKLQSLRRVLRTVTLVAIVLLPLLSLIFKPSHLLTFGNDNYLVCNKTLYLLAEGRQYRAYRAGNARAEGQGYRMTESEVDRLLATHPEWGTPADWRYPLERPFVADTSLNRHFTSGAGKRPPSVVVIIVESMGNEFMGCQAMPFVDSLAATGLYWPNCLSATTRSYGAIPAITGSVGGPKSFQFGDMPAHNSIISLLKDEGYDTRAYYGGDFTFDCIYEYLTAQGIGYLSPFYDEFRASPDGSHGHWWGAGDDYLFGRTMDDLKSRSADRPQFALVTTLSMHDDLDLPDRDRQRAYEQRARKAAPAARNGKVAARYAAAMLTDDCTRDFIRQYRQLPDYENTIFVITGDHASGLQGGDYLAYHHVPLIVWSPLVKSPQRFDYVVTHNDIAPALYSLLTSRYGVKAHPTVHWLGDGLMPTPKTLLIVNYMHEITDIIYHNYYYKSDSRFTPEALYCFDSTMTLRECSDKAVLDSCRRELQQMTALYNYTYHADRLTAHPVVRNSYALIRSLKPGNDLVCSYPDRKPSEVGDYKYPLLAPTELRATKGFRTARIDIEADVEVNKNISMLEFPDIIFTFSGGQNLREGDRLSKFFTTNSIDKAGSYHLSIAKEFPLGKETCNTVKVEIGTPYDDKNYVEGVTVRLYNIKTNIYYGK